MQITWQQLQQDHAAEKELEAAVPSDSWCQTDPKTQPSPQVRSQSKVVHPQFLWRHKRNVQQKRASFKLERIIKKQRLLEVHRGPEQLRARWPLRSWVSTPPLNQQAPHESAGESPLLSRSGGDKGLRGSGAGPQKFLS